MLCSGGLCTASAKLLHNRFFTTASESNANVVGSCTAFQRIGAARHAGAQVSPMRAWRMTHGAAGMLGRCTRPPSYFPGGCGGEPIEIACLRHRAAESPAHVHAKGAYGLEGRGLTRIPVKSRLYRPNSCCAEFFMARILDCRWSIMRRFNERSDIWRGYQRQRGSRAAPRRAAIDEHFADESAIDHGWREPDSRSLSYYGVQ